MSKDFFIFGNQSLELKEKTEETIRSILPKEEINEYSVFRFDINEFYSREKEKNERLLNELQNTCETVSWLSSKIVVVLDNIQAIPTKKSPTASIEAALEELRLVKLDTEDNGLWGAESVFANAIEKPTMVSCRRMVSEITAGGGKTFYLQMANQWNNIDVKLSDAPDDIMPVKEFLKSKLTFDVIFDAPPETVEVSGPASEKLIAFLKRIIPSERTDVRLIFTANAQNTRVLNKEVLKLLEAGAITIKTTIAYDDFRPVNWIIDRAKNKGLLIKPAIADLLIEICGSELSVLDGELEKLSILFEPETKLMASDLLENVSYSKKFGIFRVADFLVKKDIKNALESMEAILRDHPSDAISIFGIITSQFRRLLKVSWMLENGTPEGAIINQLKLNQWIARQIIQQSRSYTCRELENIVVFLSKQDLSVKYHAKEAMVILEQICYQICLGQLSKPTPIQKHWVPVP